jgi:hypothetical protein
MRFTRIFVLAGALALTGMASPARAQQGGKQSLDSATLVNQFPEALVYEGVARARDKNYSGAIDVWEQYLGKTGHADSATINPLIREAERRFFQAYPLARLYQGVAHYASNDFDRAIDSWQKYLAVCTKEGERRQVRELILTARKRLDATVALQGKVR